MQRLATAVAPAGARSVARRGGIPGLLRRGIPLVALLVLWWFAAAPLAVGGATTITVVAGDSMQPLLASGDVAVARAASTYASGDLAVFRVNGGVVIHRLVEREATGGWRTQGDNNAWIDPWVIDDDAILGSYRFAIPQAGAVLVAPRQTPWLFAGALAVLLVVIPAMVGIARTAVERRRVEGAGGTRIASRRGTAVELVIFVAAIGALVASVRTLVLSLPAGGAPLGVDLGAVPALSAATALLAAAAALVLGRRLVLGEGLPEPERSLRVLDGLLDRGGDAPTPGAQPVASARRLRAIALRDGTRAHLHVDPMTQAHAFTVVDAAGATHEWSPSARPQHAEEPDGAPTTASPL